MANGDRTVYGGGGGAQFATPNFDTGWGPGFAAEGFVDGVDPLLFSRVYEIDDETNNGTTVATDNDWFSWDPAGDEPERLILKRQGFYWVSIVMRLTALATEPWRFQFRAASGNSAFWVAMPPGLSTTTVYSTVVPLHVGQVSLGLDPGDNVGLLSTERALTLVPLFV